VSRPVVRHGFVVLVAVVVGMVPLLLSGSTDGSRLPSAHSGADPLAQAAYLAHAADHLPWQRSFWDAPWFHPVPWTQGFLDPMVGPSVVARTVPGDDAATDYRWVLWVTVAGCVVASTWCARRFGTGPGLALLAGVVYAIGPYAAGHFHHLNQVPSPWLPLGLGAVYALFDSGRPVRWALVFAAALALQASWSVYATAALLLGAVALVVVLAWRGNAIPVGALGVAALASGVVLVVAATPYVLAARALDGFGRDSLETLSFQARWFDLWKVPAAHLLSWPGHDPLRPALYPGVVWFALAVLGAWAGRSRREVVALVVVGAVGLGFAFGRSFLVPFTAVEIPLPFAWLQDHLWPLQAIRDPSRFAILFAWATAVLATLGLRQLLRRKPRLALLVVAVAVVDLAPGRFAAVDASVDPGVVRTLRSIPEGEAWIGSPAACDETSETARDARFMLWAEASERPVAGGASGFVPPSIEALRNACCAPITARCRDALRAHGVEWVLSDRVVAGEWTLVPVDALPLATDRR